MPYNNLRKFIWHFVCRQKGALLLVFLVPLLWPIDATLWPYVFRLIIDTLAQFETNRHAVWPALHTPILYGISLWLFLETSFRTAGFCLARIIPRLEADIRMHMFDHVQHHSPKYFNERFAGSLANKITDMTTHVSLIGTKMLWLFIPAVTTCVVSLFFFFNLNPFFALLFFILICTYATICYAFSKKCAEMQRQHGEVRSSLLGKIVDSFTNNFAVNLFYRFRAEKAFIQITQKTEQKSNHDAKFAVEIMRSYLGATFLIGVMSIYAYMLYLWSKGALSTGEVVQILNMTWNVVMILWMTGVEIPPLIQSIGIAKQALSVLQDPQDIGDTADAQSLIVKKGEILFQDVTFQHGEKKLFENKNVHIKGGEKVGLVGFSGAGKSTFISLILRLFPVEKGKILIDGQPISDVTLKSLRHQVALIPQDPLLFHRTLEENIRFGNESATKSDVIEAAKSAHCDEFISKLPLGYETLVGERGTKLSGGERQRIAIARAILANTPILILDEATSALDSVTEKYIQDSLTKLMEHRTTIVIAHRLSTLAQMDRILVFHHGKIVEEGTHAQLLSKNSHYAKMWHMQAGGFLPDSVEEEK